MCLETVHSSTAASLFEANSVIQKHNGEKDCSTCTVWNDGVPLAPEAEVICERGST